jgi:hypothetical protein
MTLPVYGTTHRGIVRIIGAQADTYLVEIPALTPGQVMGPIQSTVPDLLAGDRVLLTQVGTTRGDLVIVGRLSTETLPIDLWATWLSTYVAAMSSGQPYREPTGPEATNLVSGVRRLAQSMDPGTLLSANGYTVTTGIETASGRPYVLAVNEPGTNRAWGAFLIDLSEPIRTIIEIPHPASDTSSPWFGLRHWQLVPGALLVVAGAHKDAASGLANPTTHTGSLLHIVTAALAAYGIPQTQWHGYADATAPTHQVVISAGAATAGDAIKAAADQIAGAGFTVGRGWDGTGDTGLIGASNVQGATADAMGTAFVHLEMNATVRADTALSERLVRAVVDSDTPGRSLYGPFLARTGQNPATVGAAAIVGSSPYAARVDHVHADNPTTLTRFTTDETNIATNTTGIATNTSAIATNTTNIATNTTNIATNTSAITAHGTRLTNLESSPFGSSEFDLFGDKLSSLPRTMATNQASLSNGRLYGTRFKCSRGFTTSAVRFTVGTAGVAGTATVGIYTGTATSALTLASSAAITLTAAGRQNATISTAIADGAHILILLLCASYSTAPKIAGAQTAVVHTEMINPATLGFMAAPSKTGVALPGTVDLTDGTWTGDTTVRWCALT